MTQLDRGTCRTRGAKAILMLGAIVALSCNEYPPKRASSAVGGAVSESSNMASGGSEGSEPIGAEPGSAGTLSDFATGGVTGITTDVAMLAGSGPIEAAAGASGFGPGGASGVGGIAGANAASGGAAGRVSFHVFLLLGQSNMAGYVRAQPADFDEDPRIKVLGYDSCSGTGRQTDQWDTAAPPLHSCSAGAIGPGDYFAKTVLAKLPSTDTIGLVPCAITGEKIETFMKDVGTQYKWIVARAKIAQQAGGVIEGMLFHQGESNNGDPLWPSKVNTLVTDLRNDLGLGAIPFLAGEMLYSGSCVGHNTLVNKLPTVVSNAFVISANGLEVDPLDTQWKLHFSHDSQVTFGKRYAEKMLEVLKW